MKTGLSICAVLCMSALAYGQTLTTSDAGPGNWLGSSRAVAPPSAAEDDCQGVSKELEVGTGVACGSGEPRAHTPNGHARVWMDFEGGTITKLTWAVESCLDNSGEGKPCMIMLRLYSAPDFPAFGNAEVLYESELQAINGDGDDNLTIRELEVDVEVKSGINLVLEQSHGEFRPTWAYWPGGNKLGEQTGPSYIRAALCGITNWGDLADIGFPDSNYLLCIDVSGGGGGCSYLVKKAKCKRGCVCPEKGDRYTTGEDCSEEDPCPKKHKTLKRVECEEGGFIKKMRFKKKTGECG